MAEKEDEKKKTDEEARKVDEEKAKAEEKQEPNVIEQAKAVNAEKKELLDREEKLQTRKEKFHAEEMVSGKAVVQPSGPQKSEEELASEARVQRIGEAAGAQWAKPKTE